MKAAQSNPSSDVSSFDLEKPFWQAVLHNLQQEESTREWIDVDDAFKGPAHVAKVLIRRCQDKRSTLDRPYRLNAEQLECIALFVAKLEPAFAQRPDPAQQWLHPATVLMTIIMDGGGGCGKTTLSTGVILPLLETYFHREGVLRRAPSNKPARLIGGRTMHSGQGLTPNNSMRTAALALNPQSRQKLSATHEDAGALFIDEFSQLQGELNHAGALRTTYSREVKYKLDRNVYYAPQERWGRIAVLDYAGDHLQMPPVPVTSSMLAPLEGTSAEHKVGARIFRNAELVFQFHQAMRFRDDTQVAILEAMRVPGGKKLEASQWQALLNTRVSAAQPDIPADYYHVCYCWSIVSMAMFMVARISAREAGQSLFLVQAIDQPLGPLPQATQREFHKRVLQIPSANATKRLPPVVFFHLGMRVRFSTTVQQPFAVQDLEGTVVGFEPVPRELGHVNSSDARPGEICCNIMPTAIYVKLDDCSHTFLPPGPCHAHRYTGHNESCLDCISAVQPGVFAVRPLVRTFKFFYSPEEPSKFVNVRRKQFPLMPSRAVPLYAMQGTTADPGMVAYWFFPQRSSNTIKWLIIYVMLSRPRSLACIRSVGLTTKVREIIEQGPPEELVGNFTKLFGAKIQDTKKFAQEAAQRYGLLTGLI